MPTQLIVEYLDRTKAPYMTVKHPVAYTAPEVAALSHISGCNFAKVVMFKMDGELAMMVLPAHYHLSLDILKNVLNVDSLELALENEFSHRFPRCEIGAMPPFGHLYGVNAYMVPVFDDEGDIAFNGGTHTTVIQMPYYSFLKFSHVIEIPEGIVSPSIMAGGEVSWRRSEA